MAEEDTLVADAPPPEESSNRTFIILAILLGGIFVAGLTAGFEAPLIGALKVLTSSSFFMVSHPGTPRRRARSASSVFVRSLRGALLMN